jgi:1-acyl-sn-glycerol-3-phosphate acyltransferase
VIKDLIHTAVTGGAVLGLTGTLAPLATAVSMVDERAADGLIRLYGESLLRAAGVRHEVQGLENVPGGQCVFACNHQSHFDGPLIVTYLPGHVRFVAKAELFKIPVFGRALKALGNIKVDRSGGEHDRRVLEEAVTAVRERVSILFFAEGTRSEDGVLREFKKGAAVLAIGAQVPLVPMAVAGTRDILPKGSTWIHGGRKAVLQIGEPISTRGATMDDRDRLTQELHASVASLLAQAEARVAEDS